MVKWLALHGKAFVQDWYKKMAEVVNYDGRNHLVAGQSAQFLHPPLSY